MFLFPAWHYDSKSFNRVTFDCFPDFQKFCCSNTHRRDHLLVNATGQDVGIPLILMCVVSSRIQKQYVLIDHVIGEHECRCNYRQYKL